jgi:SPP1 family predicted phage head-tail adaptor
VVTVWAYIEPLTGRQYFSAETVNSEVTHKIKLRYRTGIISDMQVKFGTRTFKIISPPMNLNEGNVEMHLMCKEVL